MLLVVLVLVVQQDVVMLVVLLLRVPLLCPGLLLLRLVGSPFLSSNPPYSELGTRRSASTDSWLGRRFLLYEPQSRFNEHVKT